MSKSRRQKLIFVLSILVFAVSLVSIFFLSQQTQLEVSSALKLNSGKLEDKNSQPLTQVNYGIAATAVEDSYLTGSLGSVWSISGTNLTIQKDNEKLFLLQPTGVSYISAQNLNVNLANQVIEINGKVILHSGLQKLYVIEGQAIHTSEIARANEQFSYQSQELKISPLERKNFTTDGGLIKLLNLIRSQGQLPESLSDFIPPTVTIDQSQVRVTTNSSVNISGTTEAGVKITINGTAVVVDSSGKFQTNISLAPGSNDVIIIGTDKFGNENNVSLTITRQVASSPVVN